MSAGGWSPRRVTVRSLLGMTAIGALFLSDPLAAQDADGRDTSFAVAPNGVIDIGMKNGRLIVRGGNRGAAELRTNGLNYRLRSNGIGVTLSMIEGSGRDRSRSGARSGRTVELLVPSGVKLVVHGLSIDVNITDVAGDVEINVLSGDILLTGLGARAIVSSVTGDVRATDIAGDLRVSSVNGDVVARNIRGAVDITTTSGGVDLRADQLRSLQFNSTSGSIRLEGSLADDARLQFTTHSGDVHMRLPDNAAGLIEFSTFNGDMRAGAVTLLPGDADSNRHDGSVRRYEFGGGGTARITVSTFNGDVTIVRGGGRGPE